MWSELNTVGFGSNLFFYVDNKCSQFIVFSVHNKA